MTLTPQQRLEAYEWVREKIESGSTVLGVCFLLDIWMVLYDIDRTKNHPFPEFEAQKPKRLDVVYWWPRTESGRLQRLAALDRAIELVKEKP